MENEVIGCIDLGDGVYFSFTYQTVERFIASDIQRLLNTLGIAYITVDLFVSSAPLLVDIVFQFRGISILFPQ